MIITATMPATITTVMTVTATTATTVYFGSIEN
jgi:hypothetical protein